MLPGTAIAEGTSLPSPRAAPTSGPFRRRPMRDGAAGGACSRRRLETSPVGGRSPRGCGPAPRSHSTARGRGPDPQKSHKVVKFGGPTPKSARSARARQVRPLPDRAAPGLHPAPRAVVAHLQPPERLERGAGPAPQPASGTTARFTFGRRPAHDGPRDQDFTKTVPALPFRAAVDAPTLLHTPGELGAVHGRDHEAARARARAPGRARPKSPRGRRARSAVVP